MKRFVLVAFALVGTATSAYSQDYAALGMPGNAAVLDRCEDVAGRQNNDDRVLDGECIAAVESRMVALSAVIAPTELDQTIADLVVQLASIAQRDLECNIVDTEIAEAIAVARTYSSDPGQQALLDEISATVSECVIERTAAIAEDPLGVAEDGDEGISPDVSPDGQN